MVAKIAFKQENEFEVAQVAAKERKFKEEAEIWTIIKTAVLKYLNRLFHDISSPSK